MKPRPSEDRTGQVWHVYGFGHSTCFVVTGPPDVSGGPSKRVLYHPVAYLDGGARGHLGVRVEETTSQWNRDYARVS